MSLFDKKHLVTQADALPGRNTPMPIATLHAVNEPSGDFTVAYAILALNLSAHCYEPVFIKRYHTDL